MTGDLHKGGRGADTVEGGSGEDDFGDFDPGVDKLDGGFNRSKNRKYRETLPNKIALFAKIV
ncbi:MAG: hypothetical protein M3151_04100 [Actinomycetota bacterium]|nr:hypothetical protein [Actinomycetota bacterium]